jgi:hypothetical protein
MRLSCWLQPKDIAEREGSPNFCLKNTTPARNAITAAIRADRFFSVVVNLDQSRSRSGEMLSTRGINKGLF